MIILLIACMKNQRIISLIFDNVKKEDLFIKGLVEYNSKNFYDAHEFWEELWSDYKLEQPNLIQGLIQVSVGYYHLRNLNKKGAIGLLTKSLKKLTPYADSKALSIDISLIILDAKKTLDWVKSNNNLKAFNWSNFKSIDIK